MMKTAQLLSVSAAIFVPVVLNATTIIGFEETFDAAPTFLGNSNGVLTFGGTEVGAFATTTSTGQFFLASNGVAANGTNDGLFFGGNNNSRSAIVFLSLDGVSAGAFQASIDLSTFTAPANRPDPSNFVSIFSISGATDAANGGIDFDLGSGGGSAFVGSPSPEDDMTTTVSVTQLGSNVDFTSVGVTTADFTIASDGMAGDFLAIALTRDSGTDPGGAPGNPGNFTVDTVSILAIPEPSSTLLLGLGGLGLLARRRR